MSVTVTPYDSIPFPEDLVALAEHSRAHDGEPPFSDQTLVEQRSVPAGVTSVVDPGAPQPGRGHGHRGPAARSRGRHRGGLGAR